MSRTLGMELSRAEEILRSEGKNVVASAVSCRKGMDGNEKRVVRERTLDDGSVQLVYSVFKTDCNM